MVAMLLYDDEQISVWCETPECNTRGQQAAVLCPSWLTSMIVSVQLCSRAGLGLSRARISIFGYQDSREEGPSHKRRLSLAGPATCSLVIMYEQLNRAS